MNYKFVNYMNGDIIFLSQWSLKCFHQTVAYRPIFLLWVVHAVINVDEIHQVSVH